MILDGKPISDAERMKLMADIEHEPEPVDPALAMLQDDAIRRYEETRDHGRMAQLLRLTPAMWREMGPIDRKLLLDFAVDRIQILEVKVAFMSRNIVAGDFEVPDYLRSNGAA